MKIIFSIRQNKSCLWAWTESRPDEVSFLCFHLLRRIQPSGDTTGWHRLKPGNWKMILVAMSVGTEGVTPCVNAAGPPGRFHHETTLLTAFSRKPAWWGNSIPEKESGRFNWFLTHSNETKTCPFRKRGGAFYVTSSHLVSSFHEVYMN